MSEIFFSEQKYGYDKGQVTKYIGKLTDAYQAAFDEHKAAVARYNSLLDDYRRLEEEHGGLKARYRQLKSVSEVEDDETDDMKGVSGVVSRTIVNAEVLAQKILEGARAEAAMIAEKSGMVLERAHTTVREAIGEVEKLMRARCAE